MKMIGCMLAERFTPQWGEEGPSKLAYERHNEQVRATVAPERLVEWQPGDGWARLCAALDLPVPDNAFPHVNTTDEFRTMLGLDLTASRQMPGRTGTTSGAVPEAK